MRRQQVMDILIHHAGEIRDRFGVRQLALFGSVARDEARGDSDVDVLVNFEGPATFRGFMDLKFYLESLLGGRVDLVTEKALRAEMRAAVLGESIRAA